MCADCVSRETNPGNGHPKQLHEAACGQHWLFENGSWRAVSRIRFQKDVDAANAARLKEASNILGPEYAAKLVNKIEPSWNPQDNQQPQHQDADLTLRQFENKYFCPWVQDWPAPAPYNFYIDGINDSVTFEWFSPFDGLHDDRPSRHLVNVPGLRLMQLNWDPQNGGRQRPAPPQNIPIYPPCAEF